MGVTPYFEHTQKSLSQDSSSVLLFKSTNSQLKCEVVANCSVTVLPPDGHSLLVSPQVIDLAFVRGVMKIYVDERLEWTWDSSAQIQHNVTWKSKASEINGSVKITLQVDKVTTTWAHVDFNIIMTAFTSGYWFAE